MSLPPIVARVTADTTGLAKGLADASTRLATFAKVGVAGFSAVTVGLVALTRRSLENVDALAKQARSLGLTTQAFQKMALVADEAGINMGQLGQALGLMQRATDKGSEAFGRLGISLSEIQGLAPDEQFAKIAAALDAVTDPAEKTNLAMELFGRGGRDVINMLTDYSAKAAEAAEFQRRFGISLSQTASDDIEAANDAMSRLGMVAEGLGNRMAAYLAPALEQVANGLINIAGAVVGAETALQEYDAAERELSISSHAAQESLVALAAAMDSVGETATADTIRALAGAILDARIEFEGGAITGEQFRAKLQEIIEKAQALNPALTGINNIAFDGVIGALAGLGRMLDVVRSKANAARAAIPGDPGALEITTQSDGSSIGNAFVADPNAPTNRPRSAPNDIDFGLPPVATGGGGGGGGLANALASRLETLMDGLRTESEVVAEWYAEQQATLDEALAAKLISEETYQQQRERLEEEHQERLGRIREMGNKWGVEAALKGGADILNAIGQTNKKALKIAKVFAAAEALVSTYQGAAAELKKGTFGFAAAAAVIAKGLGFVAAIRGVSDNGSSGGNGGGGSGASTQQQAALPVQRVLIDYQGPSSFLPSIEAFVGMAQEAARRGYIFDPRLMGRA